MARPGPVNWLRSHPDAADALLAIGITMVSLLVLYTEGTSDLAVKEPDLLAGVLVSLGTLPVVFRRRAPMPTLAVVSLGQMAVHLADYRGSGWTGIMVALYSVGANVPAGRYRWTRLTVFGVVLSGFLALGWFLDDVALGSVVGTYVLLPTAFFLGDNLRQRRERITDLAERAERTEREQALLARELVNEERTRIARDLHDVVAHSVSVMVIQAGGARRQLDVDPDKARLALTNIEETGRQAMQEMRRILGVLREGDDVPELTPQPSIEHLATLVAADETMPATLTVEGDPRPIPAGIGVAVYRVVQEALTNVRKHAGPCTRVGVTMKYAKHAVLVKIRDDGRGAAAGRRRAGHRLVGMRERVVASGANSAGPVRGGGWQVRAVFPTDEPASTRGIE
ncbi:MAG: histidine kinase [Ilumatobacteraceae bacterium]